MTTINRSTKPVSGTDNWAVNDTFAANEINADLNTVYTLVNGNLDNVNIKPGAAIAGSKLAADITNANLDPAANILPSKIDDWSVSNAQQNATANPGTSTLNTKAVLLTKEIEQLRFAVKRAALGADVRITNGTASGLAADGQAAWFDGVVIGSDEMVNGSFLDASASGAGTPPYGWFTINAPSTLTRVALDVAEGGGEAIRIVDAGAANGGIGQNLANLRASSRYLIVCRVKPSIGTYALTTTGATGTFGNLALVSVVGGGLWQTLAGIVQTDATPTAIQVRLAATSAAADAQIASIQCFAVGEDRNDRGATITRAAATVTNTNAALNGLVLSVVPPGPGYHISVSFSGPVDFNGASGTLDVQEVVAATGAALPFAGYATVRSAKYGGAVGTGATIGSQFDRPDPSQAISAPAAGSVYSYRLNFTGGGALSAAGAVLHTLRVELKRT